MTRRQPAPVQWLVISGRSAAVPKQALRRLPNGAGILLTADQAPPHIGLRTLARTRKLCLVEERTGQARRVHGAREIRQARLAKVPLLFISSLFATASHPDWRPLPRMRAAALARLATRPAIALGGMNARRFRQIRRLGFHGWAGIGAWIRT